MRNTIAIAAALALGMAATARVATPEPDHAAHHPPGASAPKAGAPKKAAPKPAAKASAPAAPADDAMKAMQEMHAKMMAAKTPEEREALMADHMKAMQDGMAMMGRMKGGTGGMGMGRMSGESDAMGRRMDMMEMMMQMMVDREAARAPSGK